MTALDAASFAERMQALLPQPAPRELAIAVSGGADSMALALLAQEWAAAQHITLHALTVDHRLRAESTVEAAEVGAWMAARGIPHRILTWQHAQKPAANLQASAREARYGLMAEWCARHAITHLLLAHHRDDQAETVLMRLQRGSGIDGLSAMRPVSQHHGLVLLRPLLDTPKSALTDLLQARGQAWVEDPSNNDHHYTRTYMRTLLADGAWDGGVLAATAEHMARAKDYLEQQTDAAAADCLTLHAEGYLTLDTARFATLHEEIALRLLARVFRLMNGEAAQPPRFHELDGLRRALPETRTLAGCKFSAARGAIRIEREAAALAAPITLSANSQGHWDGRFAFRTSADCPDATLGALGTQGWAQLRDSVSTDLPKTLLHSLPALWLLETVLTVPHIHYRHKDAQASWLEVQAFAGRNPY